MRTGWLTKAGPYKVEHITWDYIKSLPAIDLKHPPLGLLHTTQGPTIEGALAVFRQHYAPHFTVGVDANKRGRIVQHVPLGTLAAALENDPGGVETNREVRVQIEIVGFAQIEPWTPAQPTLRMLAALMAQLEIAADIPLEHPQVKRNAAKWLKATGWVGHLDAPENAHWDPGAIAYSRLFAIAGALDEIGRIGTTPTVSHKPKKRLPVGKTAALKRAAKTTPPHPLCNATVTPKPAPKRRTPKTTKPPVKPIARKRTSTTSAKKKTSTRARKSGGSNKAA